MPEMPEVETIRRDLAPRVVDRRIDGFHVEPGAERLLVGVRARDVRARLLRRRITDVGRRGKYLIFQLDDGAAFVIHLRMTGSLRHRRHDAPPDRYLRVLISLDDGTELRFTDIRKFGTLTIEDDVEESLARLGPEPLSAAFTSDALWERLSGRTGPLKSILLNQEVVAGLGNIYVDEALFLARLNPRLPAGALRPAERSTLHTSIETVIRDGIEHRGASFRDYTDADGKHGSQQNYVRVFRRTDQPCDECGAPIRRTVLGGRATHWCPRCQPVAQARRSVRSSSLRRKRKRGG